MSQGGGRSTRLVVAVLIGAALGVIGARYLFVGSWLSLVPWTIAGLALGHVPDRRRALGIGAAFGFALFFAFMVAGYTGTRPMLGRMPFFAIVGVVGAIYGGAVGFVSSLAARR